MNPQISETRKGGRGFILLEAMLALSIFVLAVLALARCVENGLRAGNLQREDSVARRALLNRMRELNAGAVPFGDSTTDLKGEFTGMKLQQKVVPMDLVDQNKNKVEGMLDVVLQVEWRSGGRDASKSMRFYACPIGF